MMRLSDLTRNLIEAGPEAGDPRCHIYDKNPDIKSIHYRAQDVRPGGLFVAIPGLKADGHDFVDEAQRRGAAAILAEKNLPGCLLPVVRADDTRRCMGPLSARFYGNPSRQMVIIGITGTNGKTTTSLLIERILAQAGFRVGVIGTIDYHFNGESHENPVTTPESMDLQRILAQMRGGGATHVVMEASSHAIDLHRLDHCWLDIAVFTNLTQDHLDYHQTMDEYWACKKRLFTHHLGPSNPKPVRKAVLNLHNPFGRELAATLDIPCITVGEGGAVSVRENRCDMGGTHLLLDTPAGSLGISSPLVGSYNLENILSAVGVGLALGIDPSAISEGIACLKVVPGRLEAVPDRTGRHVFVDYAHTPDALRNVLSVLRPLTPGRLICVFGCGGDRDRRKRPIMGRFAGQLSDVAVVTSDNPRGEEPRGIIADILPGLTPFGRPVSDVRDLPAGNGGMRYLVEPDRRAAIRAAISMALPGDAVVIAGKGHETYQIIGDRKLEFDDRREAGIILKELADGP